MAIILASGSPRRRELLGMFLGAELKIIPARGAEIIPEHAGPGEIVEALAAGKGREVAAQCAAEDTVIAADTIVWLKDRVFGKPHSEEEAAEMLRALSGNTHEVYTGICVIRGGKETLDYERTAVRFRALTEREIRAYIATGEPMDKAGAYGIQGKGSLFIEGIDGDYYNVMGLPLCKLGRVLAEQGVELL